VHDRMAEASMRKAREQYCDSKIVPRYESYYREILESKEL
jgi:hypothetical protein